MDVALARWLVGPEGEAALSVAGGLSGELTSRLKKLRTLVGAERAAAVQQQSELRARARMKFSAADRMFFTPLGLEQATDEAVARYKSRRFSGRPTVFDLCTGIGGDFISLVAETAATGHDLDPVSAVLAEANARIVAHRQAEVQCRDVTTLDLAACDAWHLDPDRRPAGKRTTRVELHAPSAEAIAGMLARNANGAIKLAPAAVWPTEWTPRAEWEWISRGRQCRQLVAWFGTLSEATGKRRATLLDESGQARGTIVGDAETRCAVAPSIERFILEADPAVLAADLSGALAEKYGLAALSTGASYLTGPKPIDDPLVSCFEVEEALPLDLKKLRGYLKQRGVGQLEIKVRGIEQDPVQIRKRLAPEGPAAGTLLLTRVGDRHTAIMARRVGPGSPRS